jgi:hypothetical protein
MKNILIAIVLLFTFTVKVSASTPPKPVLAAFVKAYPTIKTVTWTKKKAEDNTILHEAEFRHKGFEMEVSYTEEGVLAETEINITRAQVPAVVIEACKVAYPKWKMDLYDKVTRVNGEVLYELEIVKGLKSKNVLFKADGTETVDPHN